MANDLIRYDLLVQEALCGVVKKVLGDAARNRELPGDHHFYITFRTHAPGVKLSSRMREQYPEEMTIILQHQYEDLRVNEQAFEVGLSFRSIPETLVVPFDALTGFFDPSVPFNFKFEPQPDVTSEEAGEPGAATPMGPRALPTPVSLAAVPKAEGLKPDVSKPEGPKAVPSRPASANPVPKPEKVSASKDGDKVPVAAEAQDGEPAKVVSIDAFRKKP